MDKWGCEKIRRGRDKEYEWYVSNAENTKKFRKPEDYNSDEDNFNGCDYRVDLY